ncbi:hypothetical protein [Prevotella sp.]|uniref:hypothetical protein n=1 Tax=Prevotella sp. TaxID=59823 RepID=UPI0025CD4103|nr:hypothetical protein [Prevotella sp.]
MSRLIKEDFDKLCTFIKDYSLSDVLEIDDAKKLLSSFHKKYFAYLVLIEEIHHKIEQHDEVLKMPKEQYEYLQESCSDVGQAFFLTFHGCYKGAKLLLRSSIENFLKGSCLDEDESLPSTKSVYEVFTFKETKANLHMQLHNEYALLCQDVHTADVSHMASITALNQFPSFHNEDAGNILKMVQKIIPIYITTIALKYNLAYHSMSYNYKEITNKEIINDYKKEVHNIA